MDNFKPYQCLNCIDYRWVCADHQNVSWDEGEGCGCGAEGAPCPVCNTKFPAVNPPFKDIYAKPLVQPKGRKAINDPSAEGPDLLQELAASGLAFPDEEARWKNRARPDHTREVQ